MHKYGNLNIYQKLNYITVNIQVALGLVGIINNILAFCVFSRKPLRKYSYSFYWRVMSITDTFILLHTFRHWANFIFDANLSLISTFLCKINDYQPFVASCLSTWLLLLISIDRLIVIVYPKRLNVFQKRWFQIIMVLILVIYSFLVNLHLPLNYRLETKNELNSTILVCYLPADALNATSFLVLVQIVLVNVVINNALNFKLIHFIRASRRRNSFAIQTRSSIRDRKFVFSITSLNISSCLCKLTFFVLMTIANVYKFDADQLQLAYSISVTISIVDNCDLFVINLFVNSIFYDEFFNMFK